MTPAPPGISLCMGSSCFVRGNQQNAIAIAAWLLRHNLALGISGHHCQDRCGAGPIITIAGEAIPITSPDQLDSQLRRKLL